MVANRLELLRNCCGRLADFRRFITEFFQYQPVLTSRGKALFDRDLWLHRDKWRFFDIVIDNVPIGRIADFDLVDFGHQ